MVRARRIAACDLGKASAKLLIAELGPAGLRVLSRQEVEHEGQPQQAFRKWYQAEDVAGCACLGATGLHADELCAPAHGGLPQDACLEAALEASPQLQGPLSLLSIGARGNAVLSRGPDDQVQWLESQKCSSGTGETLIKIAGRFGMTIQQADALAATAQSSIPITARCSVFAKSEMTHHGNQGQPAAALFRGYFQSIATYVAALMAKVRRGGPVLLLGGVSRLNTLRRALDRAIEAELRVADHPFHMEALGAAFLAGQAPQRQSLPRDPAALLSSRQRRFRVLDAPSAHRQRVTRLPPRPVPAGALGEPAVLGIDLGSTGSKAALTSLATGELVFDLYARTEGNPVDAMQRLVRQLLEQVPQADVRALGLTGSGREAAAVVAKVALEERASQVLVRNEIVAHAAAAIRCDPLQGESLSVVEIGGQDAKFVQVRGGRIVECDMNKACSAGTGSFLEEQAVFYGVREIGEFTRLAAQSARPPDLGQMCTVFVADAAAEARNQGFALEDLFGGFQYAVICNYLDRVMGQCSFGRHVFFQGKPASGPSLAWTLAAVTEREVFVPPNPGAMGAWGIGLCAREELLQLAQAPGLDLHAIGGVQVLQRSEFRCRDRRCATFCSIERLQVQVAGVRRKVLSGGACTKYEVAADASQKLPTDAPSAFDEREALLRTWLDDQPEGEGIGLPMVGALAGFMPWLATFLRELGLGVRVLRCDGATLGRGEAACYSFDACAPVKLAHGLLDGAGTERVFFPKLLSVYDPELGSGLTCPMEQAMPEMVREALRSRGRELQLLTPRLHLERGSTRLQLALLQVASQLGASRWDVPAALERAWEAQDRWQAGLVEIGERVTSWARQHEVPLVVLCGLLHTSCEPALDAGVPRALRRAGVQALPMDCLAIPSSVPWLERVPWAEVRRSLRAALACRARGDVYPLLLSAFGCGPSSFSEQLFDALLRGHPHMALESDGHGGEAGFVTRVQAFLHTVRRHDGQPSPPPAAELGALGPLDEPTLVGSQVAPLTMGDRLSAVFASVYRSYGVDAVTTGPASASTWAAGRRDCSGKECLPYQLIWGGFREHLQQSDSDKPQVLLQVPGAGMCRNCLFTVKDQVNLARMGLSERVSSRHVGMEKGLGFGFMGRLWLGFVVWDLLMQLAAYLRPVAGPQTDLVYQRHADALEGLLRQPAATGLREGVALVRLLDAVGELVERTCADFAQLRRAELERPELRTVLLSGDIYLRVDEFSNDGLVRGLNELGLQVQLEPAGLLAEYFAAERMSELLGLPTEPFENAWVKRVMAYARRVLYARARRHHPWLPPPEVQPVMQASRQLLDRYPRGEAPVTIGSVLHHWQQAACDGVVVVSPWGCGPALVAESLLRHRHEIPMLFIYGDGTPADTRRLKGFGLRLQRRARRTGAASPVPQAPGDS